MLSLDIIHGLHAWFYTPTKTLCNLFAAEGLDINSPARTLVARSSSPPFPCPLGLCAFEDCGQNLSRRDRFMIHHEEQIFLGRQSASQKNLTPPRGLEPRTWWLTATRSTKLSYRGISLKSFFYKISLAGNKILTKNKFAGDYTINPLKVNGVHII